MKQTLHQDKRSGVTMVETAIVLPVFLLILIGLIDAGLAIHRLNEISWFGQKVVRQASLRGSSAAGKSWGPKPLHWSSQFQINDSEDPITKEVHDLVNSSANFLVKTDSTLVITWPDGSNHWGDRAQVEIHHQHNTIVGSFIGFSTMPLTSKYTTFISH